MTDFMQYKGYCGSVHFDEEAMIFYGKVEFIRAVVSYEATNAKGLKKGFEEAVDDYLAMCKLENIKPELPFKGSLSVRLGSSLHRRIALVALHRHVSINKIITETLDHAFHQNC